MRIDQVLSICFCIGVAIAGGIGKTNNARHCEPGWQLANGRCYRVFGTGAANGAAFSARDARLQCQLVGAELVTADGCLPLSGSCESSERGAMCAKPFSNCGVGWYEFGRNCYQLNSNLLSWDEAKTTCNQMGGDLFQIFDEATQKWVNGYLPAFRKQNIAYIWIGIYQVDRSKPLSWTSGPTVQSMTYNNWFQDEPSLKNSVRNAGRLMVVTENGAWQIGVPTDSGGYICQLPLGTSPIVPTPNYKYSCPAPWQLFRGSCYLFVQASETWQGARDACQKLSPVTDLVDIRDAAEQEFVQRNLNTLDIWIGLYSKPGKWGDWYWNDDEMTATYFNWIVGEPNNAGGSEYCVEIWVNANAKWNDKPCNFRVNYACKRPADINGSPPTLAPTTQTPRWDPLCGAGWYRDPFSNFCYMINLDLLNWQNARVYCQSQQGDLTSITSLSEKTLITGRIQGAIQSGATALGYWIGFNDLAEEGRWVWTDGSPVPFLNWDYGEPNNYGDGEHCGQIISDRSQNFFWNDNACRTQYASVCKKPASTATTIRPAPTTIYVPGNQVRGCPAEYTGYNNMCYRFYYNQYMKWNDARQQCKNDGGDLVSMEHKQEQEFVYEMVKGRGAFDIWIGLHDTAAAMRTMYFQWSDGSPVTFTYWNTGEPNDWADKENCVEQYSWRVGGYWNDVSCDNLLPFVCKRRQIALVTLPPTTRPMGCPIGYDDLYNGNCYRYVVGTTSVSWKSANAQCQIGGGNLVSILSSEEQGHLNLKLFALNAPRPFWIGLYKMFFSYAWTAGPLLGMNSYTNWASGADTKSQYAIMYPSGRPMGTWTTVAETTMQTNYVCKRRQDGPTTPAPPPTTYDPRFCAAGWVEADGTCYRAIKEISVSRLRAWDEARTACKQLGGDLASIHSINATEALRPLLVASSTEHYWIGLNSRDTDQSHRWIDGTSPNYFNWKPNEPNNFNKLLNCVLLDPRNMQWYVASCTTTANYICETAKGIDPGNQTTVAPTTGPADPDCGSGWKYYKGSCYYVTLSSNDWFASRKFCKDKGSDLVSILDDDENSFVHREVARWSRITNYWIGLNELGQTDGYKWSDGSAVSYLNWKENEPNNAGGAEHCVTLHGIDGMWNDDQCSTGFACVCKRNNNTGGTDPPATPMPGECPKDYFTVGNKCFRLFGKSTDVVTWSDALNKCANLGGVNKTYLASISTEYEQAALIALAVDAEVDMWIGMHTRQTSPRKYVWIDNSQITYANWDRGEPNGNSLNPENCVEMYAQKYRAGKWNDIRCESNRGYICMTYKQVNIRTTWPGPQPTRVLCSGDWMQYGSACFKFFDQPATWDNALKQCQDLKGNLASVHDVWEQNYLHSLTKDKTAGSTWVGLSDKQSEGTYAWSDGWPVLYTYWGPNQPNEETGKGCVRMDKNGKWFNGPCVNTMPFLCRISYGSPPTTPPTIQGRCPTDEFVQYGQHCYYISESRISSNWRNFAAAQLECKLKGGDLASISSQGEQDFLAHTIAAKTQGNTNIRNFWIGMARQLEDGFQWMDGSPVNYVHWAQGEPSDKDGSGGENCVEMYHLNYQWNDVSCSISNAYVCKVAKRPFTAGTQGTASTSAVTTTQTSTSRATQSPEPSTTATTESVRKTTVGQTGKLLADTRDDLLVGGMVVGFILLLVGLVFGVFFYRRQQPKAPESAEAGFSNANWSKGDDAVTLDTARQPTTAPQSSADSEVTGFANPSFVATSAIN